MKQYDLIIAGAGASGLMAALSASREGLKVLLLEKMEKAGRKVRITGKGRCNITNTKPWNEFSEHIYPKSNFFKPAFRSFSNSDTLNLFEEIGLEVSVERGERAYPASGKAADVVTALTDEILRNKAEIKYMSKVTGFTTDNNLITSVSWEESGVARTSVAKALIIATGGLSYPLTGSDGDGYKIAAQAGHSVSQCLPSLTALMPVKFDTALSGLLLKNVAVKLFVGKDLVQEEFGDTEFTSNGLEGPLGLRISRKAVRALSSGNKVFVDIDLKPALTEDQIIARIKREFSADGKIRLNDLLVKLLPKQLIIPFGNSSGLLQSKILSLQFPGEIYKLADLLKCWRLEISGFTSFERCVITAGGINLDEILPKTMASRIIPNLFFAGEVIDLDGDTGGYNLQIAFSTGHLAGRSAAYLIKKSSSNS